MPLTREQKQDLAGFVISHVANLAEFWSEYTKDEDNLKGIDYDQAMQQIADWMGKLPGSQWDTRLPSPRRTK